MARRSRRVHAAWLHSRWLAADLPAAAASGRRHPAHQALHPQVGGCGVGWGAEAWLPAPLGGARCHPMPADVAAGCLPACCLQGGCGCHQCAAAAGPALRGPKICGPGGGRERVDQFAGLLLLWLVGWLGACPAGCMPTSSIMSSWGSDALWTCRAPAPPLSPKRHNHPPIPLLPSSPTPHPAGCGFPRGLGCRLPGAAQPGAQGGGPGDAHPQHLTQAGAGQRRARCGGALQVGGGWVGGCWRLGREDRPTCHVPMHCSSKQAWDSCGVTLTQIPSAAPTHHPTPPHCRPLQRQPAPAGGALCQRAGGDHRARAVEHRLWRPPGGAAGAAAAGPGLGHERAQEPGNDAGPVGACVDGWVGGWAGSWLQGLQ